MAEQREVHIESMAFGGYGVARVDGKVLFVPYSVTGDTARVEWTEEKKSYAMGRLTQLIEPSPFRTVPPCPYFGVCGGCQWQHIDYPAQGRMKERIFSETLERIGGLKAIPPIAASLSPKPYGYRVRVRLKTEGKTIGYYREKSHLVVDVEHCPISHPLVNEILSFLRRNLSSLPPVREIEINVSPEEGKGIFILHPWKIDPSVNDFVEKCLDSCPVLKGAAVSETGRMHPFGDPSLHYSVSLPIGETTRTLRLRASPGSFFQVNPEQNQALVETMRDWSDVNEEDSVLDLYAGIGNFTLPLALFARQAVGVEENRTAAADGRFNAVRNGIRIDFVRKEVEAVLKSWTKDPPDLMVLDPPRTGCKEIIPEIRRIRPRRIVYVSCDPTTLARDLRLLVSGGYSFERAALVDLFPQSYHMETVALLKRPY